MTLDAAWAKAEAALPTGWTLYGLFLDRRDGHWIAEAIEPDREWHGETFDPFVRGDGPTPAAALHALAERLSDAGTAVSGEPEAEA